MAKSAPVSRADSAPCRDPERPPEPGPWSLVGPAETSPARPGPEISERERPMPANNGYRAEPTGST